MIKKVLVSGHDLKFWHPLQQELEATGLFEFKEDKWRGHNEHNPAQTLELIEWADIIVAEWTLGNAVFCANHKKPHQRLVTRLHLQERNTDFPSQLNYEKVDLIVFVGCHILDECVQKFKMPREKVCVIGNFVDYQKYHLPKFGGNEFNVGMIGTVPARKRLDLAIDTLRYLVDKDQRYMLHIKGASPPSYNWLWARTKERQYYEDLYEKINSSNLRYNVVFDPANNDVEHWLKKIGYLISPSDFESFHMAVAEGISSGSVPVVWNWDGATSIYPILELVNTPKQAADFINILRTSNTRLKLVKQSEELIKEKYDAQIIKDKWIDALLTSNHPSVNSLMDEKQKKIVLVVYSIYTWETFHRREMLEALGRNLSDYADLLIIEPGSHYQTILNKGLCSETELNIYAQLKPIQVADNIFKIRILQGYIPNNAKLHPALKAAGSYENAIQVATKHIFGDKRKIIHWIYKPNQRPWVPKSQAYIYEVYDEYTMNFSTGGIEKEMAELEPKVLTDATHIFFTSEPLAERKKMHCHSYSIVGNGVAFEIFNNYRVDVLTQPNLRHSVGYLGNLSDFFDWPLMLNICEKMPEIDFFFHGQVEYHRLEKVKTYVEKLQDLPNTYFSGRISRPVGATSINRYDALIIPFVINEAMHAVNPLKLWEYFATGKPVVSSPMDAVKIPEPYLRVADTVEKWIDALKISIIEVDEKAQSGRLNLAKANSWDRLTKIHADVLKKL
ncbi:glycosyltransferase family 4 protein [Limnospira platensis CENA597]|uniref:glycosyltransferase family 4 protein n=1 Tax=Limnospira platensis TaxID=118562 RepID=UPI003D6E1E10